MAWTFNSADYTPETFSIIPQGDHRVRISDVSYRAGETAFKSGKEGYEITLEVSGHNSSLWYYLVLDPSDVKKTNQKIGTFFESFGITDYDMNHFKGWVGKIGGVRVKHEEYNGSMSAKVAFCLSRKNQDKLPAWKGQPSVQTPPPQANFVEVSADEELPF